MTSRLLEQENKNADTSGELSARNIGLFRTGLDLGVGVGRVRVAWAERRESEGEGDACLFFWLAACFNFVVVGSALWSDR